MSTPNPPTVWSRIYDDVKMQIPGVSDAVFKQALYLTLADFFERTNIWIEEVPIAVNPSTLSYPFTLSNKGRVNRLMIMYDPAQVPPVRWVMGGIEMRVPNIITFAYAPASGATWNAVIAKVVGSVDTDGYPEMIAPDQWIISKYFDGIESGVLGKLQTMPAKPYTNLKLGAKNWQDYVAERGKARADAIKSNVYGAQRWQFPQNFATVSRKGWV